MEEMAHIGLCNDCGLMKKIKLVIFSDGEAKWLCKTCRARIYV